MHKQSISGGLAAMIILGLSACGGGSGGGVESVPTPPLAPSPAPTPTPTPAPTPPAQPPIPAGPIGLQSNAPFATQAAYLDVSGFKTGANAVQFSYSATDNTYTIAVPGHDPGKLVTSGGGGSYNENGWIKLESTSNDVVPGSASRPLTVYLAWPASEALTYTSTGQWYEGGAFPIDRGIFAYGIPTSASDVPVTGSASYAGTVHGLDNNDTLVGGTVVLAFDFGAGTLSGAMKPELYPWDVVPLGTYTFRDTVYSTGSTTFSGAFNIPGSNAPSSFSGNFNGPQANEFMASWTAPYVDPSTNYSGTMIGIWKGKKD